MPLCGYTQGTKQNECVNALQICEWKINGAVALINKDKLASIETDEQDDLAVLHAARNLQNDLQQVAGNKYAEYKSISSSIIIVGTLGHNKVIDQPGGRAQA